MEKKTEQKQSLRKNIKQYAAKIRRATAVCGVMMAVSAGVVLWGIVAGMPTAMWVAGIAAFGSFTAAVTALSGAYQNVRPYVLFQRGLEEKDEWILNEWTDAEQKKIRDTFRSLRESGNLEHYRLTEGRIVRVKEIRGKDGYFSCVNCGGEVAKEGYCEHCGTTYE